MSVLRNDQIEELWKDPLLRHSNVLGGLFHSKVVLCESDSDCRFYSAVLSSLYEDTGQISPDILFLHCGGKHRMPVVIRALKNLDVPISVICDFDILNGENPLHEIFTELQGNWEEIRDDWRIVKEAIDQKRPELETASLKQEIDAVFNNINLRIFPKENVLEISKLLRKASPWSIAKEVGKAYVPPGNPTASFNRLNEKLILSGLNMVEVGELESFCRSEGNHGPKWVNEVLKKDLKNDAELDEARKFISKLTE